MSSERPLVSVITPTYNHEKFIKQCIDSVLAQTYPNWKQMIIDDGSSDRTREIINEYDDERIQCMHQTHKGIEKLSKTLHKGLRHSKGELVTVLEGDDFWPPDKLENQIPAFKKESIVLAWGKCAIVNEEGHLLGIEPHEDLRKEIYQNKPIGNILKVMFFRRVIRPQTAICRKDALKSIEIKPWDYLAFLQVGLLGEFSATNKVVGYYRHHRKQTLMKSREVKEIEKNTRRINEFILEFYNRIPAEVKSSLNVKLRDLITRSQERLALGFFVEGRRNLINREWKEARKSFKKCLLRGSFTTKLKALGGMALSYLETDGEKEKIAMLMKKTRWK